MKDDIETISEFIAVICTDKGRKEARPEALAALDRLQARVAALQKALDDRFAADQRAAKAIFAATGRTSGFPSVKEVVAYYIAENERLETELATLKASADKGSPIYKAVERVLDEHSAWVSRPNVDVVKAVALAAGISWLDQIPKSLDAATEAVALVTEENDSLRAKLERAKGALGLALLYAHPAPQDFVGQESYVTAISDVGKARSVLSELSADAPAQLIPEDEFTEIERDGQCQRKDAK